VIGVLSSLRSEVFVIESKSKEKAILCFDFLLSVIQRLQNGRIEETGQQVEGTSSQATTSK